MVSRSKVVSKFMTGKNEQNGNRVRDAEMKIAEFKWVSVQPEDTGNGGSKKCENK